MWGGRRGLGVFLLGRVEILTLCAVALVGLLK
jgi:hypothetical protein